MIPNNRKLLALLSLIVGVGALTYAASGAGARFAAIIVGLVSFLVAASLLSKTAALVAQFAPFLGKMVVVRAWGSKLPNGDSFRIVSARAISAGLHIYLRADPDASPTHLKVAQPHQVQITASSVHIGDAKYIQWAGKKIVRPVDRTLPALVVEVQD